MKFLILVFALAIFFVSCDNNSSSTKASFCDTACNNDSLMYTGDHKLRPRVIISVNNCTGDSITWTHDALPANRQMHMGTLLDDLVRLNNSAISCFIKDTSYACVAFNDCLTGRGYLMQLPFDK